MRIALGICALFWAGVLMVWAITRDGFGVSAYVVLFVCGLVTWLGGQRL